MKNNLVFVNPCADIGGAEMSLLLLLEGLINQYKLDLILPENGEVAERAKAIGVDVHFFPMRSLMIEQNVLQSIKDSLRAVTQIPAIIKQLASLNPQLVHINSYRVGIPFTLACKKLGIPSIWHFRDIPSASSKKKLLSHLAKLPTKSIAISNAVSQALNATHQHHLEVIYNGVTVEQFYNVTPGRFREEMNLPADAVLFCTIGQIIPWKGHDFLIKAFAHLKSNPKYYLVIVGGNVSPVWEMPNSNRHFAQNLVNLVREYGLEEKVIFTGFRKDIPRILSDIDIYVHSATAPEPFGRVLIEAMAAKKPVVAPNWGGIPEIVADKVTGLLYRPKDLSSLTDSLEAITMMQSNWQSMGEVGLHLVQEKFTAVQHISKMQQVIEQIIHK